MRKWSPVSLKTRPRYPVVWAFSGRMAARPTRCRRQQLMWLALPLGCNLPSNFLSLSSSNLQRTFSLALFSCFMVLWSSKSMNLASGVRGTCSIEPSAVSTDVDSPSERDTAIARQLENLGYIVWVCWLTSSHTLKLLPCCHSLNSEGFSILQYSTLLRVR